MKEEEEDVKVKVGLLGEREWYFVRLQSVDTKEKVEEILNFQINGVLEGFWDGLPFEVMTNPTSMQRMLIKSKFADNIVEFSENCRQYFLNHYLFDMGNGWLGTDAGTKVIFDESGHHNIDTSIGNYRYCTIRSGSMTSSIINYLAIRLEDGDDSLSGDNITKNAQRVMDDNNQMVLERLFEKVSQFKKEILERADRFCLRKFSES